MASIGDKQIDFIESHLKKNGITRTDLRNDLIDHICCCIQERMNFGTDFQSAFTATIENFGNLRAIEIETNKAVFNRDSIATKILTCLNFSLTTLLFLTAVCCVILPIIGIIVYGLVFLSFFPFILAGILVCLNGIDYKKLDIKHFGT